MGMYDRKRFLLFRNASYLSFSFFSFVSKGKSFSALVASLPRILVILHIIVQILFGWFRFIHNLGQVAKEDLWDFFFNKNRLNTMWSLSQGDTVLLERVIGQIHNRDEHG